MHVGSRRVRSESILQALAGGRAHVHDERCRHRVPHHPVPSGGAGGAVRATLIGLFAGTLFGAGLVVSGMPDPRNIVRFLDVTGRWNPNLAFVMAGAIGIHATVLYVMRRRERAAARASIPPSAAPARPVDGSLVVGAAVFGVGWGLS